MIPNLLNNNLKTSVVFLFLLTVPIMVFSGCERNRVRNFSNVLLITLDTVRYDYIGACGNPGIKTPWLDLLSKRWIQFTEARSSVNSTNPSHASIFTSFHVRKHGLLANCNRLSDNVVTLAELCQKKGMVTGGFISSAILNAGLSGLDRGFQTYEEVNIEKITRTCDITTQIFLEWFNKNRANPFFAWLHLYDAHAPYKPPVPYNRIYYPDLKSPDSNLENPLSESLKTAMKDGFIEWLWNTSDIKFPPAQYMGAISFIDEQIGKVFINLKKSELFDKTLIVITADHGESLGEHDIFYLHITVFDNDLRVPLIIYSGNKQYKNKFIVDPVSLVDVLPTIVEMADINVPHNVKEAWDGQSLVPLFEGKKSGKQKNKYIIAERDGLDATTFINGQWKYLVKRLAQKKGGDDKLEFLYNIFTDPQENINYMDSEQVVGDRFRKDVQLWLETIQAVGITKIGENAKKILYSLQYIH
ncbi:MAG: hypothetical protein A2161_14875 [Candidatus Schekmanbacteria bacterium RBG_13_48_7]|uniref:Sulfatase N-terminal domain-containing protein n=1 Tax=Candidatus Schekmanbacteria bacterium RBG_13_48_7 TaxID=1817878 RepID=A0A1F7RXI6_9BACT|nr:MAG: hypothetical protein A2161_14875 [Candidatus Schekmanbacteria bacterium RBG_13_48_7]